MNNTKVCLLQIWSSEPLMTIGSFKTYFIPLDVFKIFPELLTTLEICNGEKIPIEFIKPLFKRLEDLSSDDKQYIKYNHFFTGMLPIRCIVTKIINIAIVENADENDFYPERIQRICSELLEK